MVKLSAIGDFVENLDTTVKERGTEFIEFVDKPTNGLATVIFLSIWNFSKHGPREAAALSYYALFSLFPLLLLLVIGIGQIIGPATTGDQLQDFLALFLPGATALELSNTIERFVQEGNTAGLVAGVSLAWSALSLFSNLEAALSRTFRDESQRPFLKRRAVGLIMVIGLGALLIANIMTSLLFSFLSFIFFNQSSIWLSITGIFVPFGFSVGIFAMMYRWIPRT
ncbi:MAG: YihY/virulence factor BrkB family protein, partial [Anaerolineales bacterium]